MKKSLFAAALVGATLAPLPALAQEVPAPVAAALSEGAMVYGPNGNEVGTIKSMPAGNVTVDTGSNSATLPAAAFGLNGDKLVIAMTREQLDAAVDAAEAKAEAALTAALIADAPIKSSDGVLVGTIKSVEGENVMVNLTEGPAITLKREHMMTGADGLKLFMTAAQLKSAVSSAAANASEETGA